MFQKDAPGSLVAISGSDPTLGRWEHHAFVPNPLGSEMPELSPQTFTRIADARASLATLDSTARQLPDPTLLRSPDLDGNGRHRRLLILLFLQEVGVLSEPTLAVSPWFEARRTQYYDHLLRVSTNNDWDGFVRFFAEGLEQSARSTREQMIALVAVQGELKEVIRSSKLRADSAQSLVDVAVANSSFTVRKVEAELELSYGRANKLVGQLVDLGVLSVVDPTAYKRRFFAPRVLSVLTGGAQ